MVFNLKQRDLPPNATGYSMTLNAKTASVSSLALAAVFLYTVPVLALDEKPVQPKQKIETVSPNMSVKLGAKAYRAGDMKEAVSQWTAAAEAGHAVAQWRLARMYADGKGVRRDDGRAFKWLKKIVDGHADDEPGTLQGQLAGRAFVELGSYYREGISGTIKSDLGQAWRMYYQAASVFNNGEAQYRLGLMFLDGEGIEQNRRLAVNWLRNAAEKGHVKAQAKLGELLFGNSSGAPRSRIEGLMWLSIARNHAHPANDAGIVSAFEDAYTLASDEERMHAATQVRRWQQRSGR